MYTLINAINKPAEITLLETFAILKQRTILLLCFVIKSSLKNEKKYLKLYGNGCA